MNTSQFESKVKQTLKQMKLSKKERIVIALSGGKDSAVTAYLLKKYGYNIEAFHINLEIGKYSEECLLKVRKLCELLEIKLHLYDMKKEFGSGMCYLRSVVQEKNKLKKGLKLKNCAICGVIKKWIFNKKARELHASKIATGHNLDDEAETFLMNIMKGSLQLSANIGIETRNVHDKKFVSRIKPLFFVSNNEIRKYALKMKIPFHPQPCPCRTDSYRIQIRNFVEKLSDKEKLNLMDNFFKLQEKLERNKKEKGSIRYCEICGEPSRNEICKMCELVKG